MVDQFENPFGGNYPIYKAGRLPGIENNPIVSSYIASQDMVWMKAKDNALIVNLLEPDSGYTLHDDEPLPATKDDALPVYEIDETTG
ncbi:hypothetical protein NUU61_008423 [Penicillium alfredii]|uniref:Uncharacterized protein n=1 Tax=Penicillium alfredii TaxID=1506179 RepID=A0A9W9ESL6_9EURO|nr:uncharacterized protein NUU61_008423 [Penicillium alfredii]KAJ5087116.1 hypothetical protein NUU61_008423 [Penicillium alfredii]